MKNVFIPQAVSREGERYLEEKGYRIVRGSGAFDRESLKSDIADCDAMLLRTLRIDREICPKADEARANLCGDAGQRYCMRSKPGCQRDWTAGVYDRTGDALRSGYQPGHQGMQPQ